MLYLFYTADVPKDDNTTIAMFVDDMTILLTFKNQLNATEISQNSIDNIFAWTRR